ncbi:MAG: N-acetylmannosamine-6-phosphate 2-epimerase [Chloroflexi bacterium]|nr:N-acetylmannosamine-6-phosphate 2-epimerase [Chloroflexota bacterium]
MNADAFLAAVKGKLIVSCQALEDEPLHGSSIMAKMATAAKIGGAAAIRANSPADIRAIKEAVDLPVIGLYKRGGSGVFITPTFDDAAAIAEAGADIIALDCTDRPRPDGLRLRDLLARIHDEIGKPTFADVSTLKEAQAAAEYGVGMAGSTLSGYTGARPTLDDPDFELLAAMVAALPIPVIAEGRIHTPGQARQALDIGAWAVVVGSAITRPRTITARFVSALRDGNET